MKMGNYYEDCVAATTSRVNKKVIIILVMAAIFFNHISADELQPGTRWALLIAGSNGYENYRHQADVCHAYQLLIKGGIHEENIIVFMYDDIAFHPFNPRPGVIINKPDGLDVYQGVPKDYTGQHVNANNLFAAILGNKSALTGGSGKVLNTGPHDHIFIYYTDHGAPGLLGMPDENYVYAKDLINVLKKKHQAKAYKTMVIYVEACESGSIFEGLLPDNINIYTTTAANAMDSSYAAYCPEEFSGAPTGYDTCLGDLYSIAWLEDSDKHDLSKETLRQQYQVVKRRTAVDSIDYGSHVMMYGNKSIGNASLVTYIGTNPDNYNYTSSDQNTHANTIASPSKSFLSNTVSQRDASLVHYWHKFQDAPFGSKKKMEARKQLEDEILNRKHVDYNIEQIGKLLFAQGKSSEQLNNIRPQGESLVDDWNCFKIFVKTYEKHCGRLSRYGMKYTRALANICNAGITMNQMVLACLQTCPVKTPS